MKKAFLIFLIGGLFLPSIALAQPLVHCSLTGDGKPACTFCDLFVLFDNITTFLFKDIIPILAGLMIAVGGVYYLISRGEPEKLASAKKIFSSVAIGLLIAYSAWLIVNTFFMVVGISRWDGFDGGWWQINCPTTSSSSESSAPTTDEIDKAIEQYEDVFKVKHY
ncbi:pilin [Patescibacteria group bacterium]|nr:pilin [Patescibacteria group bacterium]